MNNYDVLVFGGSSGIGLASAIEFSKNSLSVLALSRNATASDELKKLVQSFILMVVQPYKLIIFRSSYE